MKKKKLLNTKIVLMLALISVGMAAVISGCTSNTETGESQDSGILTESRGKHTRDAGESGSEGSGEGNEESGTTLALNETYDTVRNGARLIMAYDPESNSFIGTVENTTGKPLTRVRVEVHLSNGVELGPTTPVDLAPGEKRDVTLTATMVAFDGWTAHPEVGSGEGGGEHGNGGEGGGEHGNGGEGGEEGGSEHGGGGD